jgi:hypothetical protein
MSFVDGKKNAVVVEEENRATLQRLPSDRLDGAAKFLEIHRDLDVSHIDVKKLRHKIDWRVSRVTISVFSKNH